MMKAQRHISPLLCVLLFLLASASASAERLPVRIYTSADGLGSNFINCMMRDSHGFMWFCTRDGLSRFDGSRFVTYQVGDKNAPPGIEQILETSRGIYWIVTTGGLYRFNKNAPADNKTYNTDRPTLNAELVSNERSVLYEDRSGTVWAGGSGLYRLEEKDGKVSFHDVELNLPANTSTQFGIAAICEGKDGSLWLVTSWGLVRRLPDGREIFYSVKSPRTDASTSVMEDREGRIWFGRVSGVYVIKPESPDKLAQPNSLTVKNLDELARPQSEKQVRLPEKPGEVIKYSDSENLAIGKYVYQTADGHIWISGGDGVVEFDGHAFHPHTTAQGLIKGSGQMVEDTSGNR